MPELPEVEIVAKALDAVVRGRVVNRVEFVSRMRFPFDAEQASRLLRGRRIAGVRRRAKYIIMDFDKSASLLAHLGMTGYFHVESAGSERHKHERVVFHLRGGDELRFADARRFGFVKAVTLPEPGGCPDELAHLGVEPLCRLFSARAMRERAAARRKCPVKVFVMDQAVVVGVGNIYASEALFAAGIDPCRPASDLSEEEWRRLVDAIKTVLRKAIRKGGSTIRNYRTVDGSEGAFQRALNVYGKAGEACPVCGTDVKTMRQGGRSTFYCPHCQH